MNITPFVEALKQKLNDHKTASGYTFFDSYDVTANEGGRYFKVHKVELAKDREPRRAIVCFVDKNTGDIYKPASYAAPAKHARGNILSAQNGMEAFDAHCNVFYLRG